MRRNDLARKITSWLTLGVFSLQPSLAFAADIVADAPAPEAQRPYVTETASGVPLVQIARPDGGDVSVNRYEHLAYKIGGFTGILIAYMLIGFAVIYYAYDGYKKKTEANPKDDQQ